MMPHRLPLPAATVPHYCLAVLPAVPRRCVPGAPDAAVRALAAAVMPHRAPLPAATVPHRCGVALTV
jgi:hypothetical protein